VAARRPVNARVLRDVQRELRRLERERDALDRAIVRLRQALAWLVGGAGGRTLAPQSLTTACRAALRAAPAGLAPRDVKRILTRDGFDWAAFTNPMSAVHTVLKRLVAQGEALSTVDEAGKRRFAWRRRGWDGYPRTQAEEAARIEHLLDGALSGDEYASLRKRWREILQKDMR
jgi:hypothetical protein